MKQSEQMKNFCKAYLQSMDPVRAAAVSGTPDGYAALGQKNVQACLDRMRENVDGQLRREDALRRLAQLAFGRANDAAALALRPREIDPADLDLSAVAEIKVTDKGGVEIKLVDRVRALETLCSLLESGSHEAEALYEALRTAAAPDDGEGL